MHCIDQPFTISKLWVNRNSIEENPVYQRESAIWSLEKKQLFIDSILNKFDIPKLYFHDLRNSNGLSDYAVVDGKQRLYAIFSFLQDDFPLASDFSLMEKSDSRANPEPGQKFSEMPDYWKEEFKATSLSIVLIQNAADEDIEELFSRLNNGEPLNAAEKRNAMGGDMCRLIREISINDFFKRKVKISNKRYQHYELSAKFILLEKTAQNGLGIFSDLKKRYLDELVMKNKKMTQADFDGLNKRVSTNLKNLSKIFDDNDPLLSKQAYPPLFYIFVKKICTEYAHNELHVKIKNFLEDFSVKRVGNLNLPEEDRDPILIEFGRLMQQGTNDINSLKDRVNILTRYFLLENNDLELKDVKRNFNDEERYVIWVSGGKKCELCSVEVSLEEMHADHKVPWAKGGKTILSNSRCLCVSCNTSIANKK